MKAAPKSSDKETTGNCAGRCEIQNCRYRQITREEAFIIFRGAAGDYADIAQKQKEIATIAWIGLA